jgi:NADPH2:quinone reductase
MAMGTAGFTAALALHRMEQNGQTPDMGPIIVTGASGGVGCLAIDILTRRGYEVVAVSGKADQWDFLKSIGAKQVITREEALSPGDHPLEKSQWGGAVDTVGGAMLASLIRTTRPWGSVASIGLAAGTEFSTTVMPFILRGVSLLGIDSANCPYELRCSLWQRLAAEWKPHHLEEIVTQVIGLEELDRTFNDLLAGKLKGRILVETGQP